MRELKRICRKCTREKPLLSFPKRPKCAGGRGWTCEECKNAGNQTAALNTAPEIKERFFRPLDSKVYIITCAQNATPVHPEFWKTLQVAAEHLDAELVVIPIRYRNPTSMWTQNNQKDDWWDADTVPFLFNVRKKLNASLVLVGDVKTIPTASQPLSGFESLTGAESCIIGHTKMQFKTVPVPVGRFPKILTTTGACTRPNFTDSKSGKIGAFHHFLGALIVEIQNSKIFHIRQVNADRTDGSFIDLDTVYTASGVKKAPPALGLVMGDTHARFIDSKVDAATFGPEGIIEALDPKTLVFHDLLDGYAINPHHAGNPFIAQAKHLAGFGDVMGEIEHAVDFLRARANGRKLVVVSSNHDDFLSRWVVKEDWKRDPSNARTYLETALAMLSSSKMTPQGAEYAAPFKYWLEQLGKDLNLKALDVDESFKLGQIECGLHGHRGPNGAQGTLKNLSRLGAKVISGHTHSPGIEEGHYQCGTSTPLRLEYTEGPGSWLNTHCAVYANEKRALITVIDGVWRLPSSAE